MQQPVVNVVGSETRIEMTERNRLPLLFDRALTVLRETVGNDGEPTRQTLHALGNVHREMGQFEKAQEYAEEALSATLRVHGRDLRRLA